MREGKGGGGSNGEEQEEGEDEACNTVPLLAVDLSARSIRWRKRRSREFHRDYHTRTILQFSLAANNIFEFENSAFRSSAKKKKKETMTRLY